jgi:Flp pilus assembly protein TadG
VRHAQSRRALAFFRRAVDGVAAVEFALLASVLVAPLTLVLYDVGTALFRQMEVSNAARAGAGYAAYCGCFQPVSTIAGQPSITSAVANASSNGFVVAATPAPSEACACPDGTLASALGSSATPGGTPSCGGTNCTAHGGGFDSTYVTVNAQATYNPIFPIAGVVPAGGFVLTSSATVRIN